jgi:acetyl/propionyl-CoA carboxylase alpha subunit
VTDYEVRVSDAVVAPASGWRLELDGRGATTGRLVGDGESIPVVVEGSGSDWVVTLRGRRIPVAVLSKRERLLSEAGGTAGADAGPLTVKATLPGLVVAVRVTAGAEVAEGDPLLTIEAMKMQNEVRAPRAGRVGAILVAEGQAVATGAPMLRLE